MNVLRPTEAEALTAWAALVDADAAQVARVREPEPPADHYGNVAHRFRPGLEPSPELPVLLGLAQPEDRWLDIGAGGGRFAVPLAARVARLLGVEPSEAMRRTLRSAASEAGRTNIEVDPRRWPVEDWAEQVDVALAAHSMYDIRDIGPFLDAMDRHAARRCVAVASEQARTVHLARLFEAVHGEPLAALPSLRELVALLGARGVRYEVTTVTGSHEPPSEPEATYAYCRARLWLRAGSEKEHRMRTLVDEWYRQGDTVSLPVQRRYIGIVTWEPRAS